jgi:hypothetical protein
MDPAALSNDDIAFKAALDALFTTDQALQDRATTIAALLHNKPSEEIATVTLTVARDMVAQDPDVCRRARLIVALQ